MLSQLLFGGYLGMLSLLWTGLFFGASQWKKRFGMPDSAWSGSVPRLSVVIPARNEALNIETCVRAACASTHPDLEIIVVDDSSSDGTASLAVQAAGGDPRVRVHSGAALPAGWAGKPWACQQGAQLATGAHLLFIDADVQLNPEAALSAAKVLEGKNLDLLSGFGTWRLESFWERAAIPVIGWFIRGAIHIEAVNLPGRPEAFANGQFILVRRAPYEAIGGHAAVQAEVLDDVRLARAMKKRAYALGLYFAPELFSVRLYRGLGEIVAGYGKNLYEGMDRKPHVAIIALLFLFVTLGAPWVALAVGVADPTQLRNVLGSAIFWLSWLALTCVLPIGLRWRLERLEGRSGALAWMHPLGNVVLAVVLVRALTAVRSSWKGRVFHDGKALSDPERSGSR
jgi:chlorobactene glucosyltransferase